MFYNSQNTEIYRGKNKGMPSVAADTDYSMNTYDLDKDLQRLARVLPKPIYKNCAVAFWRDNLCVSFSLLTIYNNIGKELQIICDNEEDQRIINEWNNNINIHGDSIEDFIVDMWIDNVIGNHHYARVANNIKQLDGTRREMPDLQRLAPETIEIVTDPYYGWRKFVQTVTDENVYDSPASFINGDLNKKRQLTKNITIPDDPKLIIHTSLFKHAPMETALPFVVMKYWDLAFMRKYAEKMWSPFLLGFVGNEFEYPQNKEQMSDAISQLSTFMLQLKNNSVGAFPGNTKIDMKQPTGTGDMYIKYMELMDAQISYALYSSISLREQTGVYKGDSVPDEMSIRFNEAIRDKIERTIKRFYVNNLPITSKESDIKFVWPEQRLTNMQHMRELLDVATKSAVFKDAYERRRAFAQLLPFLSEEELTPEEAKRLQSELVTMLSPSQPGESTDEIVNKGKKKESGPAKPNSSTRKL